MPFKGGSFIREAEVIPQDIILNRTHIEALRMLVSLVDAGHPSGLRLGQVMLLAHRHHGVESFRKRHYQALPELAYFALAKKTREQSEDGNWKEYRWEPTNLGREFLAGRASIIPVAGKWQAERLGSQIPDDDPVWEFWHESRVPREPRSVDAILSAPVKRRGDFARDKRDAMSNT